MKQQDCNGNFYQVVRGADGVFRDVPVEPSFEEYEFKLGTATTWRMSKNADGKLEAKPVR